MIGSGIFLGAVIFSAAILMSVAVIYSKDRPRDYYVALYAAGLILAVLAVFGGYTLITSEKQNTASSSQT